MKQNFRSACFALTFLSFAACDFYKQKDQPAAPDTQALIGRVDFAMVRDQVFVPFKCTKCHAPGGRQPTLVSYQDFQDNLRDIEGAVFGQKPTMPKDGPIPLPAGPASLLRSWLDEGGPLTVSFTEPMPSPAPSAMPSPDASPVPVAISGQVDYAMVHKYLIQPLCLRCHAANKQEPVLETYRDLRDNLKDIVDDVLGDQSMPKQKLPTDPLPSEGVLAILRVWNADGAPEVLNGPSPVPSAEPSTEPSGLPSPIPSSLPSPVVSPIVSPILANYTSIRQQIFLPKCLNCHKPGGKAQDVPLDDYQKMLASPRGIVDQVKPEESGILIAINRPPMDKKLMPPKNGPLPAEELAVIQAWVMRGSPEN